MASGIALVHTTQELETLRAECFRRFEYVPETGELLYKVRVKGPETCIGDVAGSIGPQGYSLIRVLGKCRRVHRLIFLMHHGYLPDMLDHIDRNPRNNRIENLRGCTNSQNQVNSNLQKNNTSGLRGVTREGKKWRSKIKMDRKTRNLGLFSTKEEAHAAYCQKASELYGEFARLG